MVNNATKIITILGSGVWGSALANLACLAGHKVYLWGRCSSEKIESVVKDADIVLSAVSINGVTPTINKLKSLTLPEKLILVTATKGLDPETTNTPSQMWKNAFPNHPVVVLSGPNLSKEIQKGLPAATVVASEDLSAAKIVQKAFSSKSFRVYVNADPLGTELGGTLKNIMAIAAGICDGLQLGINAKSALLTRALPEMIRVGTHLGASAETFFGLSGMGDLIATCDSHLSRNYQVGYGLAQGKNIEEILANLEGTAEGVNTTKVLIQLADKKHISVPIARQVYKLLIQKTTPQETVQALMERELKPEFSVEQNQAKNSYV